MKSLNKIRLLIFLFSFTALNGLSQSYTLGLPCATDAFKPGQIIVANIPTHSAGRFVDSESLKALLSFLKNHQGDNLTLEVHISSMDSDHKNLLQAEKLSDDLAALLDTQAITNCEVVAVGSKRPLFLNSKTSEKERYKSLNTRIEIYFTR